VHERVRYLLARRFAREGRWQEARVYYPLNLQSIFDEYVAEIKKGNNEKLSEEKRAKALWKTALITRYEGMELMGTEVEQDWFVYRGHYKRKPVSQIRSSAGLASIVRSSPAEQHRLKQNVVNPEKRFHYRYKACEYAWQAAKLTPDESAETAWILRQAGSWLENRDPKAADRFYKAFKKRCGKNFAW